MCRSEGAAAAGRDRPARRAASDSITVGPAGANATSPDNIPLGVTNALLGGSFGSRITSNIREKLGCTYSPGSQVSRRYHDAYWVETADITDRLHGKIARGNLRGNSAVAERAAGSHGVAGNPELSLPACSSSRTSSRGALIGQLRCGPAKGWAKDYLKTYVQKVNAVTPAECAEMTAEYIKPEQMTIVVVGDKAKITEQLAPYAANGRREQIGLDLENSHCLGVFSAGIKRGSAFSPLCFFCVQILVRSSAKFSANDYRCSASLASIGISTYRGDGERIEKCTLGSGPGFVRRKAKRGKRAAALDPRRKTPQTVTVF